MQSFPYPVQAGRQPLPGKTSLPALQRRDVTTDKQNIIVLMLVITNYRLVVEFPASFPGQGLALCLWRVEYLHLELFILQCLT